MDGTGNAFARVLVFYHQYCRTKINEADLTKVAKKYKSKPSNLLDDLTKKYPAFSIPERALSCDILRIKSTFVLPKVYLDLMPPDAATSARYDTKLDILSREFDSEYALQAGQLVGPTQAHPPLDNMSKVSFVYFHEDGRLKSSSEAVEAVLYNLRDRPAADKANREKFLASNPQDEDEKIHPFDIMMAAAVPKVSFKDDNGIVHENESPLTVLMRFQKQKQRVRVLVRRKGCLRGSIDAYIKAFDQHFNLLLVDADEVYISNHQKRRRMALGNFVKEGNVIRRHLSQLIMRGDNVVSVFAKP